MKVLKAVVLLLLSTTGAIYHERRLLCGAALE